MTIQANAVLQKLFLRIKITSRSNYVTLIIICHEHQNKLKYILCTERCVSPVFSSLAKGNIVDFFYLTKLVTQLGLYWRDTHITRNMCTGIRISLRHLIVGSQFIISTWMSCLFVILKDVNT